MDELLTINEAAELLGVHPETLRRWDRENKLPAVKINDRGDRRYNKEDLEHFMNTNRDLVIDEHSGYIIKWQGRGFVSMTRRFAVIGKIYATKDKEVVGFAFVAAGLTLFSQDDKKDVLNELALKKVKEYLDKESTLDGDIYTFEYINGELQEVQNPEWWEDSYRKALVKGLRVEVSATHPTTSEQKAWRVILNYKSKSNNFWFTNTFGKDRQYREYYVFIDAKELVKADLPNTAKGAEVFALGYGIKRFNETRDSNSDRDISRIGETKVACYGGSCKKNEDLPNDLLA